MTASTYMQRAFDILTTSTQLLTVPELAQRMRVSEACAQSAIERLRRARKTVAVRDGSGTWRYGLRASAQRPTNERGRPTLTRKVNA